MQNLLKSGPVPLSWQHLTLGVAALVGSQLTAQTQITSVEFDSATQQVTLHWLDAGGTYSIQASDDLAWDAMDVDVIQLSEGDQTQMGNALRFVFTDADATGSTRFWRVVTQSDPPDPSDFIDLSGTDFGGRLIHPVELLINGTTRTFRYWDRNGDGIADTDDQATQNTLATLFNEGNDIDDRPIHTRRTTVTIADGERITLALPTVNGADGYPGHNLRNPGTSVNSGTDDQTTYDGLLAIWDAHNGAGTEGDTDGTPAGWPPDTTYWTATKRRTNAHAVLIMHNGRGFSVLNTSPRYVALEVVMLTAQETALDKIALYADQSSNPTPTVQDYADAGVTGVTAANLADVNAVIAAVDDEQADETSEVQALATPAIALAKIAAYAGDDTSNPAPTAQDYADARVTGITSGNLANVNAVIAAVEEMDADTTAEIQALVDLHLTVLDLSGTDFGGQLIRPVELLIDGTTRTFYYWDRNGDGVISTDDQATQDTLAMLLNGGTDTTDTPYTRRTTVTIADGEMITLALPTVNGTDGWFGHNVGVPGTSINSGTEDQTTYDGWLAIWDAHNGAGTEVDTDGTPVGWAADTYWTATIRSGVAHVVMRSNSGRGFSISNTSPRYVALEVVMLTAREAALDKIASYADQSSNPTPTRQDYADAGVTGVTNPNLADVNAAVAAVDGRQADTRAEVQALADPAIALAKIANYALNNSNPAPRLQDYADARVTGGTAVKLGLWNAAVDALTARAQADTTAEVQAVVDAEVIDLSSLSDWGGLLIHPVKVKISNITRTFYYWDRDGSGDNENDTVSHNTLDNLFNNGSNTENGTSKRQAMVSVNGESLTLRLPTYNGPGKRLVNPNSSFSGTSVDSGTDNQTHYDGLLAIWDAHNGSGTEKNLSGVPPGWRGFWYWSASQAALGGIGGGASIAGQHGEIDLRNGRGTNENDTSDDENVALEVID